MSKSIGRAWKRGSGTVTVIEAKVHRSSARNAWFAFVITWIVVGVLAAPVLSDWVHPILALLLAVVLGGVAACLAWAAVRVWPVVRLLWWWTPEIGLLLAVVSGFTWLAHHTTLPARVAVVVLLVGVPAAVPWTRRRIVAWAWCLIVRHRIRICFNQFIIANRSGTLPLILWARPTPVGERVWIWLRTGLSLTALESRLDQIAVACWASTVTVARASDGNAAYVVVDVKRRDTLTSTVLSPLPGAVDPDTPTFARPASPPTDGLDLSTVTAAPTVRLAPRTGDIPNGRKPAVTPAADGAATSGDDVNDWI